MYLRNQRLFRPEPGMLSRPCLPNRDRTGCVWWLGGLRGLRCWGRLRRPDVLPCRDDDGLWGGYGVFCLLSRGKHLLLQRCVLPHGHHQLLRHYVLQPGLLRRRPHGQLLRAVPK